MIFSTIEVSRGGTCLQSLDWMIKAEGHKFKIVFSSFKAARDTLDPVPKTSTHKNVLDIYSQPFRKVSYNLESAVTVS